MFLEKVAEGGERDNAGRCVHLRLQAKWSTATPRGLGASYPTSNSICTPVARSSIGKAEAQTQGTYLGKLQSCLTRCVLSGY